MKSQKVENEAKVNPLKRSGLKSPSFFGDALHILALAGFAVAQPIFDLLSRHPEFLVSWKSKPVDLIFLILILTFLMPLTFVIIEGVAGLFGILVRRSLHAFFSTALFFVFILQVLEQTLKFPGIYMIVSALLMSMAATTAYFRFKTVRFFTTVLSPAALIFPLVFLFNPAIHKIVFADKHSQAVYAPVSAVDPVIMVVFDEFPLTSLLNKDRLIDAARYPHFAALSQDAYWFRNATTVAERTFAAVPAILTGLYPDKNRIPTASDFPHSLFTLLGGSYKMKVFEPDTMLCPDTLCKSKHTEEDLTLHIPLMLLDLSLVYLHIIVPEDLTSGLPPVTLTMKGFLNEGGAPKPERGEIKDVIKKRIRFSQSLDRARLFHDFVESIDHSANPTLYFLHVKIPHLPWEYLPSGKRYSKEIWGLPGLDLKTDKWSEDNWLVFQGYQRHLLQVAYADRLLGDLIGKLKRLDLYEKSLLVVTADHGVSFFPNRIRRMVYSKEKMDILTVPLMIKAPHQGNGVIDDRNVETIDILPTIADILNITFPWTVDGHSAFDRSLPERREKIIYNYRYDKFIFGSTDEFFSISLERKLSLFGKRPGIDGLFKVGPYDEIIGRKIGDKMRTERKGITSTIDQETFLSDVDPAGTFIPAQITGRLLPNKLAKAPLYLAVAVNGLISAVSKSYQDQGKEIRFSFMVPESAFRAGRNEVEIFAVSGGAEHPKISRIGKRKRITYSLDSKKLKRASDGLSLPIVEGAFAGSLDTAAIEGQHVVFSGWAADVKALRLPEAIVIFVGGEFLYSGPCNRDRPDVVEYFGDQSLYRSGFRFMFPLRVFNNIENLEVRVFALFDEGVAAELAHHHKFSLENKLKEL